MSTEQPPEEGEEYEVLELESEEGEVENFVVLDRIALGEQIYALLALLEDFEQIETMTEEEFQEHFGEEEIFILMRQEDKEYFEITEEEYNEIKDDLEKALEARGQ